MAEFRHLVPAHYQPPLPVDRFVVKQTTTEDAVPLDVLFVGGGPAGLAGAIELARLARVDAEQDGGIGHLEIGVLEKSQTIGGHCLSGAVVNPMALRELFPGLVDSQFPFRGRIANDRVYLLTANRTLRFPTPPTMVNHGNYVASICEVVRWMAERAEELDVQVMPGYPADSLLVQGNRVTGVRTSPSGLRRDRSARDDHVPPTDLTAKVTVLAEGTRGPLTQAYLAWQQIHSANPPTFGLGIKELWETPNTLDAVIHTLGWPLPHDTFGGSFMYPMADDLISVGLVVGLDYRQQSLDPHLLLQRLKLHPLFRRYLAGGTLVEWGAKTIPEGGFYSLPERLSGDGIVIVGDAAGLVDVPSLKGIHYAIHSGILAARAIYQALLAGNSNADYLSAYDHAFRDSYIHRDLYQRRNMRLAFKSGLFGGALKAALMTVTRGRFPGQRISIDADSHVPKIASQPDDLSPDGRYTFSKSDAVFYADNATRDDVPSHLTVGDNLPEQMAEFYHHLCPAGVYEWDGSQLVVNAPNCVDCKATDVVGPRWKRARGRKWSWIQAHVAPGMAK